MFTFKKLPEVAVSDAIQTVCAMVDDAPAQVSYLGDDSNSGLSAYITHIDARVKQTLLLCRASHAIHHAVKNLYLSMDYVLVLEDFHCHQQFMVNGFLPSDHQLVSSRQIHDALNAFEDFRNAGNIPSASEREEMFGYLLGEAVRRYTRPWICHLDGYITYGEFQGLIKNAETVQVTPDGNGVTVYQFETNRVTIKDGTYYSQEIPAHFSSSDEGAIDHSQFVDDEVIEIDAD